MFISFSLTYRFSDYYFVCAIGGQHDGHLSFWLPSFVKLIMLLLHVLFAIAEINILPLLLLLQWSRDAGGQHPPFLSTEEMQY